MKQKLSKEKRMAAVSTMFIILSSMMLVLLSGFLWWVALGVLLFFVYSVVQSA